MINNAKARDKAGFIIGMLDSAIITIMVPFLNIIQLTDFSLATGFTKEIIMFITFFGFEDIILSICLLTGISILVIGRTDRWGFIGRRARRLVGAMASPPASGASPPSLVIDLKSGSNIRVR